jgi:ABC-type glycerol-3-phosphate transport system substrate-binding protein
MKRLALAAAAALVAGAALAQTATTTTTTTTISPAQETAIKTYVTKEKPKVVQAPSGFTVSTGAVVPQSVEVHSFPADVGVTGYSYTNIGGKTVVVGSDRKIVRVID